MENNKFKCPKCKNSVYTKNGFSGREKNKKQKFKCKFCGKSFVERNETLSRTEKRLLSLFVNFVSRNAYKDLTLKDFLKKCNEELPGMGKSRLKIGYNKADITKLQNIIAVVCKNEEGFEVIKFDTNVELPWQEKVGGCTIRLSEFAKMQHDYWAKLLD